MKFKSPFSYFVIFLQLLFCFSCNTKKEAPLFELMKNTGIDFTNKVQNTKDFNIFSYRNFYNGAGVAIGDINNDGLADIFFTANMGSNKLYINKGNWEFEDISARAGFKDKGDWSTGVVMADVNNDGWLDIFVCNAGYINGEAPQCQLFINNHDLTFTDSAAAYGLLNKGGYTTHAAFFDYDLDGDLDCFIINNSFIPVNTLNYANTRNLRAPDWPVANFLKGGGDHLLRNDNGHFTDVSKEAGIYGSLISFGLGVTVGDINGDHYPDVYVSNDFFERDYLYINQGNGTFKDELPQYIRHTSLASMGADMADINNDGYPDIFTTDMLPADELRLKTTASFDNIDVYNLKVKQGFYNQFMQNTLQLNNGNGKFMDIAYYGGVPASDWSWGGLIFDADNDGLPDLYVCNGIYHDVTDQDFIDFFANDMIQKMVLTGQKEQVDEIINKMPSHPLLNKAFKNQGNLKFSDEGEQWGFTQPSFSNGAAYGDLDNDGDLDLVVNNVNQPAFVFKNESREQNKNNYISIFLKGRGKNSFAVGSKIEIFQGSQIISREVIPSRGFQSSVDYKQVVGLGKTSQIDSMIIIWPNRTFTKIDHPAIDTVHIIQEPESATQVFDKAKNSALSPLLVPVQNNFDKHQEDDYSDFYYERNLPKMLSREGPQAACADVNGDGLTDIYICGASKQAGQLYLQTKNGFVKKEEPLFQQYAAFEDVTATFFDCDGDGDMDLFIGSGGNRLPSGSHDLQHRLYINDGKGNFKILPDAFPKNDDNTAIVAAYDFDNDGDIDLFVGSRSVPHFFGLNPISHVYINDGHGHFTAMDKSKMSGIDTIGMVTGAVWADITGDKRKELIIVGEWMSPHIYAFRADHFEEIKTNLNDLYGWWQTVAAADIDGDGDEDLILGNNGENFYLKPDKQHPVKLFVNDFDQNFTPDCILSRTVAGKDMPVFMKRDITDQIPTLKKQNLKHSDYAGKSVQDLFSPQLIKSSQVNLFNYCSSIIAFNDSNGKFTIQLLPPAAQFSSVNTILCTDINNDGFTDLILGGNNFGFLPQFSRLDASYGDVLLNNGKRQFTWINSDQSGLQIPGQVRDIKEIQSGDKKYLLFLQNDEYPMLYEEKKKLKQSVRALQKQVP